MRVPLAALALLLAGCAGPASIPGPIDGVPAGDYVPYETWKASLSKERFRDVVQETTFLEAKDGTSLAITVHRPKDAGDEKLPTLLQITPYQTIDRAVLAAGFGAADFWPKRGVVFAEADARGTHNSGGCLDFGGSKDREDAATFGAWIVEQPWSNGRLLVEGVSHPGMGVLVAAVAGTPGFVGGLSHAPVSSYYMDEWANGARYEGQFNGPAYQAIEWLPGLDPAPESLANQAGGACQGETVVKFQTGDGTMTPWFEDKDLNLLANSTTAPLLLTIGFLDMNVFPDHVDRFWKALPPDSDRRLILGYWTHGYPDFDGYRIGSYLDLQHRWIDSSLLGLETGVAREPRVLVEDSKGGWHELDAWPPASATPTTLWPAADGSFAAAPPPDGEASWIDDPRAERDRWPEGARVVFETEPYSEAVWIAGAPRVTLVAKSSAPFTNYVVYLFDVAPDGSAERVSHGFIDSRFPEGLDAERPPAPGTPATYAFDLMPTAHVLDAGHRLQLLVASSDSTLKGATYKTCTKTPRGGCYDPSGIYPSRYPNEASTALLGEEGTRVLVHVAKV